MYLCNRNADMEVLLLWDDKVTEIVDRYIPTIKKLRFRHNESKGDFWCP